MSGRHALPACFFLALCLFSRVTPTTYGQKAPPPTPPNPVAPVLNPIFPAGAQRGGRLELTLTGTNLAGPTAVYTSFNAKVTIPTEEKNGTDNAKLKILIDVPGDAPVGPHMLRLATTRGISNFRVFCVDDLPQVIEDDKNKAKTTPQAVPVPSVVAGKADAEQSDWFKITVAAGQRLNFDLLSRRLGSGMDPQMSIYSVKTGRELAHDNDSPGAQSDPRLTFVFKEAGDYLVEVRDVLHRGGPEFFYRLRIGDFPLASTPFPLAAKHGTKVKVEFTGPQVEGVAPVEVATPSDAGAEGIFVAPKGPSGVHGWPVVLALTDLAEHVEQEPNNEPAKAQRLTLPCGVSGRLNPSNDADNYVFAAKKGQKVLIDVETLDMHSPTLVYFVIKNAKGAELAKSNPQAAPPLDQRLEFTAPEDGDYVVDVQHLNFVGGPAEVYHLVIGPVVPTFETLVTLERYDVAPGSFAPVPITVNRKGYAGPIDLEIVGAAGLSGKGTIKAGQASGILLVVAKADMPMGPYTFSIRARAEVDKTPVTQRISVKTPIAQSMGNLGYPPLAWQHQLAIAVKEKAPFALEVSMTPPEAVPGVATTVKVSVKRDPGFDEAIELNPPIGLPPNVPPVKLGPIAKDKTELTFNLDINAKVPVGEYQVLIGGKSKSKGKDFSSSTPPLNVVVGMPFELKVEPGTLALKPGDKGKLKVTATRRGGYKGPISLEMRKLPAGLTAGKAVLNPDQTAVEIDVTAAAGAAPAEAKDADILGTATALGNLQQASPPVILRVEKK